MLCLLFRNNFGFIFSAPQVTPQVDRFKSILEFCKIERGRDEIQEFIRIKDREYFRKEILKPLLDKGLINLTIPDRPRSSKQKYIITEKGKRYLE